MPTFSEQVKEEICHLEYDPISLRAILFAFLSNKMEISLSNLSQKWFLESNNSTIIRFIGDAIQKIFNIDYVFSYTEINKFNNTRTYRITIEDPNFINIVNEVREFNQNWILTDKVNPIEQRAFLSGAFLSSGSIAGLNKSIYHLEIRSAKTEFLRIVQKILINFNLSPTILQRKYTYALYIKRANEISDFLKIIGAIDSMYKLEDTIIARDLSNQIHRINNLDIANMDKTVKAGDEQLKMINTIKLTPEFIHEKSEKFKLFCELRLDNPSSSLNELSKLFLKKYKIKVTRTGLNHYVIKLKELYEKYKI